MKLLRLKLKNFRQYRDAEVSFAQGLTAIIGPNGAGKSTLLEAFAFALYGLPAVRKKSDEVRYLWAEPGDKFSVSLEFELGAERFEVQRGEKSAHLKLLKGGREEVLSSKKDEVTARCERLLGMNYPQFKNSFCAEQKDLAFLSFNTSTDLHREISKMLGFHRIKLAEDLAKERRKVLKGRLEQLKESMGDRTLLRSNLENAEKELSDLRQSLEASKTLEIQLLAQKEVAEQAKNRAELYLDLTSELERIASLAEGLKKAVTQAEEMLRSAVERSERHALLKPSEDRYQELAARAKRDEESSHVFQARQIALGKAEQLQTLLDQKRIALQNLPPNDLGAIQSRVDSLNQSLASAKERTTAHQAAYETQRNEASTRMALAEADLKRRTEEFAHVEKMLAAGKCPECGQELGETVSANAQLQRSNLQAALKAVDDAKAGVRHAALEPAELAAAKADLATSDQALGQANQELQAENAKLEERRRSEAEQNKLEGDIAVLLRSAPELPEGYDPQHILEVRKQLEELRPSHDQFLSLANAGHELANALAKHEESKVELESAKAKNQTLREERLATGVNSTQEAKEAVANFNQLNVEHGRHQSTSQEMEKRAIIQTQVVKDKREKLETHDKSKAELSRLEGEDLALDVTAKELKALGADLNHRIFPELQMRASENLSLLTNGRYQKLQLNPANFQATLVEDDETVKTVISGGEEDVVALSLRLALSEMIQQRQGFPFSLLILDEVFGSLDVERRQAVLDRLIGLRERFTQILVISHVEGIQQVADQSIVLQRDPQSRSTAILEGDTQNPVFSLV